MAEELYAIGSGTYTGYVATYATLDDWQAAHAATDWIAKGVHCVAVVQEDLDLGSTADYGFQFTGWSSVDSNTGPIVRPVTDHGGVVSNAIKIRGGGKFSTIRNLQNYGTIEGFYVENYSNTYTSPNVVEVRSGGIVRRCFITRVYKGSGVKFPASDGTLEDCVIFSASTGIEGYNYTYRNIAKNCTVFNCSTGIAGATSSTSAVAYKNCVAINNSTADWDTTYANKYSSDCANNASGDSTAATLPGTGHITGVSTADGVDFLRPSADDYRIVDTSILKGAGVNLYDGTGTQADIEGNPWYATGAWDIGADRAVIEKRFALRTDAGWASMSADEQAAFDGYYTTISAFLAAEQGDLRKQGVRLRLTAFADWPSGYVDTTDPTVTGNITSELNTIVFDVDPSSRHTGVLESGFFIKDSTYGRYGIKIENSWVYVYDFSIHLTGPQSWAFYTSIGNVEFHRCLAKAVNSCFIGKYFYTGSLSAPIFRNCVGFGQSNTGLTTYGVFGADRWQKWTAENCVAYNSSTCGFYAYGGTAVTVKNCVAVSCGISYDGGQYTTDSTNNAASDASTVTPPGANPLLTDVTTADFVDIAAYDAHLSATSVLRGAGANLSSEFTDDIDLETRPATGAWDIGADSYYVPATANTSDIPTDVLSLAAQALSATATDAQLSNLAGASVGLQAQAPTATSSALSQADLPSAAVAMTSATPTSAATANNFASLITAQIQLQAQAPQSQTSDYQQSDLQAATVALLPDTLSAQTSEHNQITLPTQSLTVQPQTPQAIAGASNSASITSVNVQLQTSVPSAQTTEHVWSDVASANVQTQANAPTAVSSEHQTSTLLSTAVDLIPNTPTAQTTELNSAVLVSDALVIQSQAPQAISGADNSASITSTQVQVQANAPTIQTTELNTVDLLSMNLQIQGQEPQATALAHTEADLPTAAVQLQGQSPQTYIGNSQLADLPVASLSVASQVPSIATTEHVWAALTSASVFTQPQIPSFLTTEDMDVILPTAALNLTEYVPTAQTYFSGISVTIQLTATLPKTISLVAKL